MRYAFVEGQTRTGYGAFADTTIGEINGPTWH